jgi:TRAP-type C4-dicarboxylate transport system permease small subunit
MVFLGGAILVRQDKNVVITFVYDLFNLETARLVRILSELLSFTMITVMVCLSWKLIGRLSISTTPTLRINEAWFGVIAFVGFCLMLFYQAQNLIALLRGKQSFPEERGPQDGEG